jgi:Icc-related predicted phosphoesterase
MPDPQAAAPVRIACVTDLHGRLAALGRILADAGPIDALLLGGDITHFGSPIDADRVIALARAHAPQVFAVAGNCDSAAIERRLVELGVSLHGQGTRLGPVGIHGLSGIPPWKPGMYQLSEDELAEALEAGSRAIADAPWRVLLAHVPPRDTPADQTVFWKHAGSVAVRSFVESSQPHVVFCGHIHEGRGTTQLGPTKVVNCGHGALGAYALAEFTGTLRVSTRSA